MSPIGNPLSTDATNALKGMNAAARPNIVPNQRREILEKFPREIFEKILVDCK
jgi:hypothetical protein